MFLSSNRHLVAVHGRRLASANGATAADHDDDERHHDDWYAQPGDVVSSQVTIQNGELDEDSSENVGHSSASDLQVQAVVSAVGAGTVTLTVGTQTLTVPLPAGLTLPASLVGQTVTLSLSLNGQNGQNGDDQGDDDNGGGQSGHGGGDGGSDG